MPHAIPVKNSYEHSSVGGTSVKRADILSALRALGIVPGDVLMVHSSLKRIGYVDGGSDAVVDALLEAVGVNGLVAVPTHSDCAVHPYANDPAAPPAPDSNYRPVPFHPAKTPSVVGLITNTLRQRPNAVRSRHPTHSVAAIGRGAAEMACYHGPDSHFGRHTPYGWLVRHEAKILLLGVKMNSNTLLHMLEDLADMPSLGDNTALVEGDDRTIREVSLRGAPLGHRDFYASKLVSKAERALRARHLVRDGMIGAAASMLVDAREQEIALLREVFGPQPDLLYCDKPTCEFCQRVRAEMLRRFRPSQATP